MKDNYTRQDVIELLERCRRRLPKINDAVGKHHIDDYLCQDIGGVLEAYHKEHFTNGEPNALFPI